VKPTLSTQTRTLEEVIDCMYACEVLDAISEIIQSIRELPPAGIIAGQVQRDAVAEAFYEYLGGMPPTVILRRLMEKFEGFPTVEWWREELLNR